jgi:hypothetical protein
MFAEIISFFKEFDHLFYTSLIVFLIGLIYKISTWFTKNIGMFYTGNFQLQNLPVA